MSAAAISLAFAVEACTELHTGLPHLQLDCPHLQVLRVLQSRGCPR